MTAGRTSLVLRDGRLFAQLPGGGGSAELEPEELAILMRLAAGRTAREAVEDAGFDHDDTAREIVRRLEALGLVAAEPDRPSGADSELPDEDLVLRCQGAILHVPSPRRSRVGRAIYRDGVWEAEVTAALGERVRPGTCVVDAGADLGCHAIRAGLLAGPSGHVFAFELRAEARRYLERNVALNALTNVSVHAFALSDREGPPEVRRFDAWWAEIGSPPVDLVRIAARGAEAGVLTGMDAMLRRDRPALLVEVHAAGLAASGRTPRDVLQLLAGHGYRVQALDAPCLDFTRASVTLSCRPDGTTGTEVAGAAPRP